MTGYWHDEEASRAAISPDGWFATGDVGYLDDDGYLFLVDRKKDVILRGGYTVYPREVEEALYEHPAVREAVVVGVPDETLGEEVAALVVLREGVDADARRADRVHPRAGRRSTRRRASSSCRAELPHGPTGKVLRREIDRAILRDLLRPPRQEPDLSLRTTPPYRADHVGSLLRPPELLDARAAFADGRLDAAALRAVEDEAILDVDPDAGGRRAAVGDRRRVPARVVAHGLHLPAGRDHQGAGRADRAVLQRGREDRVHAGRDPHRRQARRLAHDLRRRLRVRARRGDDDHAQADDSVAEHGPLPRRPRIDRSRSSTPTSTRSGPT